MDHKKIVQRWSPNVLAALLLFIGTSDVRNVAADNLCTNETLTASYGIFSSPNYPQNYPTNCDCYFQITLPKEDSRVKLNFTKFNLEGNSYSLRNGDFVSIYDSDSPVLSNLLAKFEGSSMPTNEIISTGNTMLVHFHSDDVYQNKGFLATYSSKNCSNTQLSDSRGQIHNSGYPQTTDEAACEQWFIQGSKDDIITMSFDDLDLPSASALNCVDNYITIGPLPNITLCGGIEGGIPKVYISQRNHVWIHYHFAANKAGRGFMLKYISGPAGKQDDCFPEEFKCSNGKCIMKHWQCNGASECGDDSDEQDCIGISTLSTPSSYECGAGQSACSGDESQPFKCILDSQWCDGLEDCPGGTDENQDLCKRKCSKSLTNPWGVLLSPHFPALYPPNAVCEYFIEVEKGHTIQLRVVAFDLPIMERDVNVDFLTIYDGVDSSTRKLGVFHGGHKLPAIVESTQHRMYLQFKSDGDREEIGFNITYQTKGQCIPGQEECGAGEADCFRAENRCNREWDCRLHGGDELGCHGCGGNQFACSDSVSHRECYSESRRCDGVSFCQSAEDEMNCSEIRCGTHNGTFLCQNRHCIYEAWVCDGTNDCKDNSDEINCSAMPSVKVVTAAILGCTVCSCLLLIAIRFMLKLHQVRQQVARGYLSTPVMQVQDQIYARRSAPPLYDEAMRTSVPYEQVIAEVAAMQRAAAAGDAMATEGAPQEAGGGAADNRGRHQAAAPSDTTSVSAAATAATAATAADITQTTGGSAAPTGDQQTICDVEDVQEEVSISFRGSGDGQQMLAQAQWKRSESHSSSTGGRSSSSRGASSSSSTDSVLLSVDDCAGDVIGGTKTDTAQLLVFAEM